MSKKNMTVTVCDQCKRQTPESKLASFPAGAKVAGVTLQEPKDFCAPCLNSAMGYAPPAERVVEIEYRDSGSSGGGASGRPFPLGIASLRSGGTSWSTPLPSSD